MRSHPPDPPSGADASAACAGPGARRPVHSRNGRPRRPLCLPAIVLGVCLGGMALHAAALSPASSATGRHLPDNGTRVYRCAQSDGAPLYTQHPCSAPAGERVMHVSDERTAEQARQGQQMQQRHEKLSRSLQQDRKAYERLGKGQGAMALTPPREIGHAAARKAEKERSGSTKTGERSRGKGRRLDPGAPKPLEPAGFTARVPGSGKKVAKAASARGE